MPGDPRAWSRSMPLTGEANANSVRRWLMSRGYECGHGDVERLGDRKVYQARTNRGVVHVQLTPQGLRWAVQP